MSYKKRYDKIRRVLDHRQPDLTVVMDNVHKPHNVAAILRTCDAVGIPMIHAIVDRNLFDVRRRAASGAHKWVEVKTYNQVEDAYGLLRDDGFYDAPSLDKETYTRLLFEFTHPTVSAYCKRHSLPYPDINEKGEIISQLR